MKKILLVSGCSYGDKKFMSAYHPDIDCSWPKWPELLADKLDMECINLCRCGAGQEYIYSSIIDKLQTIDHSKIGLVIAAWSTAPRRDWQNEILAHQKKIFSNKENEWTNDIVDVKGSLGYWIDRSLRYQYSFQTVCENLNLPHKQLQMVHLFKGYLVQNVLGNRWNKEKNPSHKFNENFLEINWKRNFVHHSDKVKTKVEEQWIDRKHNEYVQQIYHSPYYEKINSNFIGWPTDKRLGGICIGDILNSDERISPMDWHPNQKGQIKITEYIYDRLG